MIVNDLCKKCDSPWYEEALDGLIADLSENHRTPAPKRILKACLFDKIAWLVDHCEPPYSLEDIDEYFVSCVQP